MTKLVLFDIDGTLLWTDGAGRRAINQALLEEAGTAGPIDSFRFDGKTDPQIVRELLAMAGHPDAAHDARRNFTPGVLSWNRIHRLLVPHRCGSC